MSQTTQNSANAASPGSIALHNSQETTLDQELQDEQGMHGERRQDQESSHEKLIREMSNAENHDSEQDQKQDTDHEFMNNQVARHDEPTSHPGHPATGVQTFPCETDLHHSELTDQAPATGQGCAREGNHGEDQGSTIKSQPPDEERVIKDVIATDVGGFKNVTVKGSIISKK